MNILICVNPSKAASRVAVLNLCTKLNEFGITPLVPVENRDICYAVKVECDTFDNLIKKAEMMITIGGDGTILRWGKIAAKHNLPLLGINTGRLGFMATLEYNEIDKLARLVTGEYSISERMLMDVEIVGGQHEENKFIAINDVVLYKHTISKLPEFSVKQNENEVLKIRADGMIFSTPTGSTAYSLSAGGPIIQPELKCIEFVPLCAHTLFARPMIFSSTEQISVGYVPYENAEVFVSVDGSDGISLTPEERVLMTQSQYTLRLIDIDGSNFYDSINQKLMRPLK